MTLATSALKVAKFLGRVNADGTAITDLEDEIKGEIGEAIRFYNRKPYALTEFRGGELTTTSGTAWYSNVDLTNGAGDQDETGRTAVDVKDILRITYMRENPSSGINDAMQRIDYYAFERLFEGNTPSSSPTYYTVYAGQIGVWPTPDDAYTLYFSAHVKPVVPTADDDTSVWLTEAEELILAAAAKRVCMFYLRDEERAAGFAAMEATAEAALQSEHVAKSASGKLRVHD